MEEGETLQGYMDKSIKMLTSVSEYLLKREESRGLEMVNKLIPMQLANKLLPYFVAAGVLDLAGKEITKSNIERIFRGADVEVDRIIINGVGMLKYKNHYVYILAITFLVAANKELTMERIFNTVTAMDVDPDLETAKESVSIYNDFAPKFGFNQVNVK
ncbi:hypothetical protein M1373_02320 [Candidatus Marsarchaeota archaeon]|nr:hypothetical protein [Candidatus Marsarchaeota archaeon]MCL5404853.1 hypothetical protein [Candidatus Marsarchaeota archaeon]